MFSWNNSKWWYDNLEWSSPLCPHSLYTANCIDSSRMSSADPVSACSTPVANTRCASGVNRTSDAEPGQLCCAVWRVKISLMRKNSCNPKCWRHSCRLRKFWLQLPASKWALPAVEESQLNLSMKIEGLLQYWLTRERWWDGLVHEDWGTHHLAWWRQVPYPLCQLPKK